MTERLFSDAGAPRRRSAITCDTLASADDFTKEGRYFFNEYDPYDAVTGTTTFSGENISGNYNVPVEPIVVKSVEVTKY